MSISLIASIKERILIERIGFVQDSLFGARHVPNVAAVVQERPGEGDRDYQKAGRRELCGCRGRCAEDRVTLELRQVPACVQRVEAHGG